MLEDFEKFITATLRRVDVCEALLGLRQLDRKLLSLAYAGILFANLGLSPGEANDEEKLKEAEETLRQKPEIYEKVEQQLEERWARFGEIRRATVSDYVSKSLWKYVEAYGPSLPLTRSDLCADIKGWLDRFVRFDDLIGASDPVLERDKLGRDVDKLSRMLIRRSILYRSSSAVLVAVLDAEFPVADFSEVWSDRGRFVRFECTGRVKTSWSERLEMVESKKVYLLFARYSGPMTRAAVRPISREFRRTIRTLVRLVHDLEKPAEPRRTVPRVKANTLQVHLPLVRRWLDAYYSTGAAGKTLSGQIQNAIRLFVEADAQTNSAVSLSLGFAGLEAIGSKRDNYNTITQALAENVATMLEPDVNCRGDAMSTVRNLYGLRSKILHGAGTDEALLERDNVRAIGAHLLRAVVDWEAFCKRIPKPASTKEFFEELEACRIGGKRFVTSTESPIRKLWERKL